MDEFRLILPMLSASCLIRSRHSAWASLVPESLGLRWATRASSFNRPLSTRRPASAYSAGGASVVESSTVVHFLSPFPTSISPSSGSSSASLSAAYPRNLCPKTCATEATSKEPRRRHSLSLSGRCSSAPRTTSTTRFGSREKRPMRH